MWCGIVRNAHNSTPHAKEACALQGASAVDCTLHAESEESGTISYTYDVKKMCLQIHNDVLALF
ncbi:hypothetical protein KDA_56820 [Dictyobacter alpinus]|uniref:Uncharacterized protein n=1 Tax=Dictyobacter alpinus TaxID=2014873 RepID=A0A402BFM1_9CHLR|nr:hypothetical protein KDA_56820 [Dictyobacter alpinus]